MSILLVLFHGRTDPAQEMDDWGDDGPVIPLDVVHCTYLSSVRYITPDRDCDGFFEIFEDLLYYDGVYYGDWEVIADTPENRDERKVLLQDFDERKTHIPPEPEEPDMNGGAAVAGTEG